jgi:hypothetical protein
MRRSGPAILSFVLLLAPSLSALAGPPVASIKGPKTATAGDLVILDASASDATTFTWVLANSDKTFLPVDGGKRCVFSSGTPGRFVFVLIVGKVEEGKSYAAETQWSVVIGGDVPTPPNPFPPTPNPPPPDPTPPESQPAALPIPPAPVPAGIEGVGTVYGKSLDVSLAMAWEAAADVLEKGGTMADAMKMYQDSWKTNREKLWTTFGAVEFAKVVPDASDVSDPAKRSAIVKLWRGFATGLRTGAK